MRLKQHSGDRQEHAAISTFSRQVASEAWEQQPVDGWQTDREAKTNKKNVAKTNKTKTMFKTGGVKRRSVSAVCSWAETTSCDVRIPAILTIFPLLLPSIPKLFSDYSNCNKAGTNIRPQRSLDRTKTHVCVSQVISLCGLCWRRFQTPGHIETDGDSWREGKEEEKKLREREEMKKIIFDAGWNKRIDDRGERRRNKLIILLSMLSCF